MSEQNEAEGWRQATQLVHGGTLRSQFGEMSEAIYFTQGYAYDSAEAAEARFKGDDPGFVYSRYANPTVAMFEERIRLLEGAEDVRATATGMAAVHTAIMNLVKAGDHVVSGRALFGSCLYIVEEILPRCGVEFTLVDGTNLDEWRAAVRPNTTAFFLESPTNPCLEVLDIGGIAEIAHAAGAKLIVDNVFATPLLQRPLQLGADVVVYSATKHIDGQGRCLGGVVLGSADYIAQVHNFLKHTGPSMSPFNAWVLLKGLETLPIRVERQTKSAVGLADMIAEHPAVSRIIYPGRADHPQHNLAMSQMSGSGATMLSFEVKTGKAGAFKVCNGLRIVKISNNLGDAKSIITHPATTTHQRLTPEARATLGITDGLLRLSVGLEDPADLADDLTRALDQAA